LLAQLMTSNVAQILSRAGSKLGRRKYIPRISIGFVKYDHNHPSSTRKRINHWYTRDGVPQYTVPSKKDGSPRNTTLRDARTMNLVPSVTTILSVAAKPALTNWLQQQVLLAALTLPRRPDEPEKEYIDRIINDSKEQGRSAADAGTDIHASIQGFYEDKPTGKHQQSVDACAKAIKEHFGSPTMGFRALVRT
jgi:hypothetical protein